MSFCRILLSISICRVGADLKVKAQEVFFGNLIRHESFITHHIVENDPRNGWFGTPDLMDHYYAEDVSRLEFAHSFPF